MGVNKNLSDSDHFGEKNKSYWIKAWYKNYTIIKSICTT